MSKVHRTQVQLRLDQYIRIQQRLEALRDPQTGRAPSLAEWIRQAVDESLARVEDQGPSAP